MYYKNILITLILFILSSQIGWTSDFSSRFITEEEKDSPMSPFIGSRLSLSDFEGKLRKKKYQDHLFHFSVVHDICKNSLTDILLLYTQLSQITRKVRKTLVDKEEHSVEEERETLMDIIKSISEIEPYSASLLPLATGLVPVKGIFSGTLNPELSKGFFPGKVREAAVVSSDDEWIFTMKIGHQSFQGVLPKYEKTQKTLSLSSTSYRNQNKISFDLDPSFFEIFTTENMVGAWNRFLGLDEKPAKFFSVSAEIPEGIEIKGYLPYPMLFTYAYEEPAPQNFMTRIFNYITNTVESSVKRFALEDGSGTVSGKFIFDSVIDREFHLSAFFTPLEVKIGVNPNFNFAHSLDVPVILGTHLKSRLPEMNLSMSEFEDTEFHEKQLVFSTEHIWDTFEEIIPPLLDLAQDEESNLFKIKSLENFYVFLTEQLTFLERYERAVREIITANKLKAKEIYVLGEDLSSPRKKF